MATATINSLGLLDPGIHSMTLDEIAELFGRFQRSDKRLKLLDRLRLFVKAVRDADPRIEIFVDGSFIMTKVDEPGDIDVALVLPADWDMGADLRPFEYNIVSKRMVRKLHGFDMLLGIEGQPTAIEALAFFSKVNVKWYEPLGIPVGTLKGLIKVQR
jgi:hypothetical protein